MKRKIKVSVGNNKFIERTVNYIPVRYIIAFLITILEVAAIIAYKQPVTRIDLEDIRGNSEYAIQKLLELKMIEPVGRKDAVGRPVLFGTTDEFLKRFEIPDLDALPDYEELLNKIKEIHGESDDGEYLYKKPELVDEEKSSDAPYKKDDDIDLPPIDEEELPDFLKGEDIVTVEGE